MSRSSPVVLYGIRWQRCRFGIMAAIFDSIRGRSSSLALSGTGDESPTDTKCNRAMAWLGITAGSNAR
jgi:hypothetical protein